MLFSFLFTKAQTSFKPGYFISNGKKTECLIKDEDWKNSPREFQYKLTEDNEVLMRGVFNTNEFGINNKLKFKSVTVNIDTSTEVTNRLDYNKEPKFKKELVFLRILVTGKASLYVYSSNSLTRFFYQKEESEIKPLIYKKYKVSVSDSPLNNNKSKLKIAENNAYKQTLYNTLNCENQTIKDAERLQYSSKDLKDYFVVYNNCSDHNLSYQEINEKKKSIHLILKTGISFNNVKVTNTVNGDRNIDFGSGSDFRFGFEAELLLPFKNNKWSVFLEPTFHSYTNSASRFEPNVIGETLNAEITYQSIELPLGIRHTIFLTSKVQLFLNAAFIFDFSRDNIVTFTRKDGSLLSEIKNIEIPTNLFFGVGTRVFDRLSLEARVYSRRGILGNFVNYSNTAIVVGFRVL